MAVKTVIDILINASQSAKTLGELEGSVEQLKEQIKGVEVGSQEFNRMAGAIQTAESRVKTLNKTFEGLEPQQIADSFAKVGEAIVGSFAAAQGAAILFGEENEDIQEQMLKAQAALSLAIGARQIAEGALQFAIAKRAATEKIALLATNLDTAAQSKNIIVKWAATAAQAALNAVMMLNPAVAIAAALIALAGALVLLADGSDDATAMNDKMNASLERTGEIVERNNELFQRELDLLKARGTDERIVRMRQLSQLLDDLTEHEKAKRRAAENFKKVAREDDVEETERAQELLDQATENVAKTQHAIAVLQAEGRKAQTDINTKADEEDAKKRKEAHDKHIEDVKKLNELLRVEEEEQQEVGGLEDMDQPSFLERLVERDSAALDAELELMRQLADEEIRLENERVEAHQASLERERDMRRAMAAQSISIASNMFGAISNLSQAFGNEAKGLAIAQAILNTYLGATQALTDKSIPNAFLRIAAAATVVINGLASVKRMMSVTPKSGGSVGGGLPGGGGRGGGGGGFTRPPDIGTLLGSGGEIDQPPPQKVFVTESDISDKQGRVNRVSQRATVE